MVANRQSLVWLAVFRAWFREPLGVGYILGTDRVYRVQTGYTGYIPGTYRVYRVRTGHVPGGTRRPAFQFRAKVGIGGAF